MENSLISSEKDCNNQTTKHLLAGKIFLLVGVVLLSFVANAQIKVAGNGHVGIGVSSPSYKFDFNGLYANFKNDSISTCRSMRFKIGCLDPRITSPSKIVFCDDSLSWNWIDIECRTVIETSDSTKKENFQSLSGNSLSKVLKLDGYTYNWKNDKTKKRHAGLLAQQVEPVIPEAVVTVDSTGEKLLAYSHFIPYLVEAIKEQQATIDELAARVEGLEGNASAAKEKSATIDGTTPASLNQNIPNPFSENTTISLYLPNTVSRATLYIYNMQGEQIKYIAVNERGNTSVTIEGNTLKAGMYLYTLIANGKEVDTKKMILTK